MKPTIHHISPEHQLFIQQNRYDPVTGELMGLGAKVVFCAGCRSAFLLESWVYLGKKHCGQWRTLALVPQRQHLQLNKASLKVITNYVYATFLDRLGALFLDVFLVLFLFPVGFLITMALALLLESKMGSVAIVFPWAWTYIFIIYVLTRDGWGGSLGKNACDLQVIQTQTGKRCNPLQALVRTLLLPVEIIASPYTAFKGKTLGDMLTKTRVVRLLK